MVKNSPKKIRPQTLKGFRDFLPEEMVIRQKIIKTLTEVFESYGFQPLETPALEYAETLLGKYGGEADKLVYTFKDKGGRKVGLRYDLTVPLARVIATNPDLPIPFKRYQIQPVWRAEKPQKGRFREFIQCDADIIGAKPPLADAEIIFLAAKATEKLGFKNFKILVNDRRCIFDVLAETKIPKEKRLSVIRTIDKMDKIGEKGVIEELNKKGFSKQASALLKEIENVRKTLDLNRIFNRLKDMGLSEELITFSPSLARGLDYYTGMIFEVQIDGYAGGSVAGGGRYDMLVGFMALKNIPAVGFSFGIDRLIEAIKQQGLFKDLPKTPTKVLVSIFSPEYLKESIKTANQLRSADIPTELYLNPEIKIDKQLKYADKKGIPYVIIVGPEEIKKGVATLKNMKAGTQESISLEEVTKKIGVS